MSPLHRLWLEEGRWRWCDCPVPGDHNANAWRSRQVLDEVGCRCPRFDALVGVHDDPVCPLRAWADA